MKNSTWWTIAGAIALIGGALALFNPFAASLAVTVIAGISFLVTGIFAIAALFWAHHTGVKLWMGLFGLCASLLGISLIADPLNGVLTLTMLAAILILVSGITRLIWALQIRGSSAFWMLLLSSVTSIALGILILVYFPQSAATILGLILGIELIFNAFALFSVSAMSRAIERGNATSF